MDALENQVNQIFQELLERDADPSGLQTYVKLLKKNASMERIRKIIQKSPEYINRNKNKHLWEQYQLSINLPISTVREKSDYAAVIVETRNSIFLERVIANFSAILGKRFQFYLFHSENNRELAENIQQLSPNIKLQLLTSDISCLTDYSKLLRSVEFWQSIDAEHILIFQTDTVLRRNIPNHYFEYDYVGAPWPKENNEAKTQVGNGGLSLRSKKLMLRICTQFSDQDTELPEDVFFSKYGKILNANIPEMEVAKQFSVEGVFTPNPVGLHKPIALEHKYFKRLINSEIPFLKNSRQDDDNEQKKTTE